MSGPPDLDLRAEIARIDRERAETQKFAAEQRKLTEEAAKLSEEAFKFSAEQAKLYAEAFKLDRDRRLAPLLAAGALAGGVGGIVLALVQLALWFAARHP